MIKVSFLRRGRFSQKCTKPIWFFSIWGSVLSRGKGKNFLDLPTDPSDEVDVEKISYVHERCKSDGPRGRAEPEPKATFVLQLCCEQNFRH